VFSYIVYKKTYEFSFKKGVSKAYKKIKKACCVVVGLRGW